MPKNILITGATGNLGTAISNKLSEEGHTVFGTVEYGHAKPENKIDYFECDLADESETQELFKKLKSTYKSLDAAICLVGGFAMGNISNSTAKDMTDMFTLNFMTAYNCAKEAYDWMNRSKGGQLIFVGAKPALEGGAAEVLPYAISKSAVIKLAGILNESENENIQASVIVPSIIDTPQNRKAMPKANFEDWVTTDELADKVREIISDEKSPLRGNVNKVYNNA